MVFYTCIPFPSHWPVELARIARWAPWVGVIIGLVLGGLNLGLMRLGLPDAPRSVLIVVAWLGMTGGLHFDGAMDTADGLGVCPSEQNRDSIRDRRLEVMADSRSGAFGVMAALSIFSLKIAAISTLPTHAPWLMIWPLIGGALWGRWGQLWAIACYPYLKPRGKGAFHRASSKFPQDFGPGLLGILGVTLYPLSQGITLAWVAAASLGWGLLVSMGSAAWFNARLGGHTGDSYGAVVEWTEALVLVGFTAIFQRIPL